MSTLSRRNLFGLTAGAVVTAGLSACAGSGGSSSKRRKKKKKKN